MAVAFHILTAPMHKTLTNAFRTLPMSIHKQCALRAADEPQSILTNASP